MGCPPLPSCATALDQRNEVAEEVLELKRPELRRGDLRVESEPPAKVAAFRLLVKDRSPLSTGPAREGCHPYLKPLRPNRRHKRLHVLDRIEPALSVLRFEDRGPRPW